MAQGTEYERQRLRLDALADLRRLVESLGSGIDGNILALSDYEVVNLKEALTASGYSSTFRSPLCVLQNGDWLGQVWMKLPHLKDRIKPNQSASELAERARIWTPASHP